MKRIITYFSVFAALLAVSCNQIETTDFSGETGLLKFNLKSTEMVETRVQEDPNAIDNENIINTVDYFFFKKSDGTMLIEHGAVSFDEDDERVLEFNTTDPKYADLRKPFYAYFLVNYKDEDGQPFDHESFNGTLEDILALPISTHFLHWDEAKKEYDDADYTVPEFVMDSGEELVYVKATTQGEHVEKTVSLYHVAAKLLLNFTVAESVSALDDTWTPKTDQMTVRFWNALKATTVKGEPVKSIDMPAGDYFDYFEEKPVKKDGKWVTRTYYTYPQLYGEKNETTGKIVYYNGEPYLKISMVWNGAKYGATRFYYKILIKNLEKIERNKYYVLNLTIDKLGGVEDEYELLTTNYYVADWQHPEDIAQAGVAESIFLDIALPSYSFYGEDEMTVPVIASHPIEIVGTVRGTKEVFKSGVSSTVNMDTNYPKTDENKSFTLKHTLVTDVTKSNYDCGIIRYNVTVRLKDHPDYQKEVLVIQYPPIYVKQDKSNGKVFVNGQGYTSDYARQGATPVYDNIESSGEWYAGVTGKIGAVVNPSGVDGSGDNNNQNQYTIYVSVLPSSSSSSIGDPRGGSNVSNLGYSSYSFIQGYAEYNYYGSYYHYREFRSTVDNSVSSKYNPAGDQTQNTIAPAFKIASSYGKTTSVDYNDAKERCASYQENGYPAGRWRLPTTAEIDFVISLSDNKHIPTLFGAGRHDNYSASQNQFWYDSYWAGGMYVHAGKEFKDDTGLNPAVDLNNAGPYTQGTGAYYRALTINNRTYRFHLYTRCVYDVWYWGEAPMNGNGNYVEGVQQEDGSIIFPSDQRATSWLGFKMD